MATLSFPKDEMREAIRSLDAQQSHQAALPPQLDHIFAPRDHEGALDPRRAIVIGDRGTGKSFWSSVLVHDNTRAVTHEVFPRLGLDRVDGILCFSESESESHPTRSELRNALGAGYSAEIIWRAVAIQLLSDFYNRRGGGKGYSESILEICRRIADDPRAGAREISSLDQAITSQNRKAVLVFDALDRMASDWSTIRRLTQGVFQLALTLRGFRSISAKVFLRPDVASDQEVWAITDSSKLRHDQIRLDWTTVDLYGLMFTFLANDPTSGSLFRDRVSSRYESSFVEQSLVGGGTRWAVTRSITESSARQREIVNALAGEFMGRNKKRGRVYTWIPSHLQDARGHATPRSFLLAMQKAAYESKSATAALDATSIQEGVRKASDVRIDELREDYLWIKSALLPLKGMAVPIDAEEIFSRWDEAGTLQAISDEERTDQGGKYLLPVEMSSAGSPVSNQQLLFALERLAIVSVRADGRRDFPDLFRVAAHMKRKGGIPVRRG